jgi:hypothetical protein
MKFLCIPCDRVMDFAERQLPGDGTLAAVFACGSCGREIAMLTNPMETQLVSSLGVKIGGREVPEQPLELVRSTLAGGREDAFTEPSPEGWQESAPALAEEGRGDSVGATARVTWTPEAMERLERVPRFVRGMVKRIYTDYAQERAIARMTPEVMDRARTDLGMEGM